MWFLRILWKMFDAVFLYPRWFLPTWSLKPREYPVAYEWLEMAWVTSIIVAGGMIPIVIFFAIGIGNNRLHHVPLIWAILLYTGIGLWFLIRSVLHMLLVFIDIADSLETS